MTSLRQEAVLWARKVREADERRDAAVNRRDAAIVNLYRDGSSLREVAEAVELSHQTIKNILTRAGEPLRSEGNLLAFNRQRRGEQ